MLGENVKFPIWNLKNVEIKFYMVNSNMSESIEIAINEEVLKGVKIKGWNFKQRKLMWNKINFLLGSNPKN